VRKVDNLTAICVPIGIFLGIGARLVRKADDLSAICVPIV
jgi:hypothetical protein